MNQEMLRGEKVRLAAANPETDSETVAAWSRDPEFTHLLEMDAPRMWTVQSVKADFAEAQDDEKTRGQKFLFVIRLLGDDRLVGYADLKVNDWAQRDAWLAIGIGRREDWGRGYGTDAVRLLLRYAFAELNLERVTLGVFDYNERAVRSYLKAGFVVEGRQRERLQRGDQRHDMIVMGALRGAWQVRALPGSE